MKPNAPTAPLFNAKRSIPNTCRPEAKQLDRVDNGAMVEAVPVVGRLSIEELAMSRNDASSLGFTAVNGPGQTRVSSRPEESMRTVDNGHDHARQLSPNDDPSRAQYHSHGWGIGKTLETTSANGHTSYRRSPEPSESRKRKRTSLTAATDDRPTQSIESFHDDVDSRKRRATIMDSAVDMRSPTRTSQVSPVVQTERRSLGELPIGAGSRYVTKTRHRCWTDDK